MKMSWRDKKTNDEVLKLADELLYIIPAIKKRKITYFGHRRMDGNAIRRPRENKLLKIGSHGGS